MSFALPKLPYALDALQPHMSAETLQYHHGKHHKAYAEKSAQLVTGTRYENMPVEEIIRSASGAVFNNVAQYWNHNFFWQCLSPREQKPGAKLRAALEASFGGFEPFKEQFTKTAAELFGSGWAWLVKNADGSLAIAGLPNAGNPLTEYRTPLLTCDVWEHAYYIDYRNARPDYLKHFWSLVNWEFVESRLAAGARDGVVQAEEQGAEA